MTITPGSDVHKNLEPSDHGDEKPPNRPNTNHASSELSRPDGIDMKRPQENPGPAEQSQNSAPLSTFIVADTTINAYHNNKYRVSSRPLLPGSPVTIGVGGSKTIVRIQTGVDGNANAIVVGFVTSLLPMRTAGPQLPASSPIVFNDVTFNAEPASNYILFGQTLSPGSTLTFGSGPSAMNVALQTGVGGTVEALVVGSSTSPLPTPEPGSSSALSPLISLNGKILRADTASVYFASGQKLALGSSIVLGSADPKKTVGLQEVASGTALIVNGITSLLSMPESDSALPTPPPIMVNGTTISADSASQYTVSGKVLAPGSSITVGSGPSATVVALMTGVGGTTLIIGSSTSLLSKPSPTPPPIIINGQSISADSASQHTISGMILVPGSSITIGSGSSATVVALTTGLGGTFLIVGSSTSLLPAPSPTPPPITVNGVAITADSASQYVVSGKTLRLGSTINIGGSLTTLVALQSGVSGMNLVIGSSTSIIQDAATDASTTAPTGGEMSNLSLAPTNGPDAFAHQKKSGAVLNADRSVWAWCFIHCLCGLLLIEQVLSM